MKDKNSSCVLTPNLSCWGHIWAQRLTHLKAVLFLGVSLCALALPERARAEEPRPRATITFENGESITIRSGRRQFRPVEILPGETVQIHLQLPPGFANTLVVTQAMDGGLTSGDVVVGADGTAAVAFQGGVQPGLYRILLSARGESAILQFSVSPSENP